MRKFQVSIPLVSLFWDDRNVEQKEKGEGPQMWYTSHEECNIGMKIEPKIDMIRKQNRALLTATFWHASMA